MVPRFTLDLKLLAKSMTIVFSVKSYLYMMNKMAFLLPIGIVSEGLLTPVLALNDGSFPR